MDNVGFDARHEIAELRAEIAELRLQLRSITQPHEAFSPPTSPTTAPTVLPPPVNHPLHPLYLQPIVEQQPPIYPGYRKSLTIHAAQRSYML